MNYISLCDGIGAAHAAFAPLGWQCLAVAEIDPCCHAVVKHHWNFENYGDITNNTIIKKIIDAKPNLIISGTPCQSFSSAGFRLGTKDPRGQLLYRFATIIQNALPCWIIWENVPGVLSVDHGGSFASFIHFLAQCGYGVGWRVLDAQYFGVPQRRRRVFLIGCLGDPNGPFEVLFESIGVSGRVASGQKTRQENQDTVAKCLRSQGQLAHRDDTDTLIIGSVTAKWSKGSGGPSDDECQNLILSTVMTSPGTGIDREQIVLETLSRDNNCSDVVNPVENEKRVRRLTPRECERLQGFPDDYTLVPYKGRPMADLPRYRMIGNSIAIPVLRRLGEAIELHANNHNLFRQEKHDDCHGNF